MRLVIVSLLYYFHLITPTLVRIIFQKMGIVFYYLVITIVELLLTNAMDDLHCSKIARHLW